MLPSFSSATTSGFQAGRIIDDEVFTNKTSMSTSQIQTFLNSKVPTCDTWHEGFYGSSGAWYGPPFTCLKDYTENSKTSAQIIYDTAQEFNINPQVLLVLLQKEQALITDTWPASYQYKTATGYGCPDTAVCDTQYYGFTKQLRWAATMFRAIINDSPTWYTPYEVGNNYIQWSPVSSCGGTTVNIENRSTQALYNYTPYQPNTASLSAGYNTGDSCSSYGNRNFYSYFTDWFGSPYSTVYNGVNYSAIFDATYYLNNYPDLKAAFGNNYVSALTHFVVSGMSEGRQAKADFNVSAYKNTYQDLRMAYKNNLKQYYLHYINFGAKESRQATVNPGITPITYLNGIDYSSIYNFNTYISNYSDINSLFASDDASAIEHFINFGIKEGRQAIAGFNITSYINRYPDLRRNFGEDRTLYYMHYLLHGKNEGRLATGDEFNGNTILNGVDYSNIYDYTYYITNNPDIKTVYGKDDNAALSHFINFGMKEGRQAIGGFNVSIYQAKYEDLRTVFGNNLKAYYLHYINNGKSEGRIAI